MGLESGIFKQLAYKIETTYGTAAGQASGQQLRRIESTIDLSKDSYESNEKRPDMQTADARHGVRRVQGAIKGEMSAGTWKDFLALVCKRDFTAVTSITGASITIGAGVSGVYPISRATGSWLTDGVKVGHVIRFTAGSLNASNLNKNILVVDITSATALSGIVLNGSTLTAEGPIASVTVALPGKQTYMPVTGHTDKALSIEHWFPSVPTSELYLGCKIGKASFDLPPTGMANVSFDVMGQDMADTTAKRSAVALNSQYFTSPTATTTTNSMAAVNGIVRLGGGTMVTMTGLKFDLAPGFSGDPVVGSNVIPNQFAGRMKVTGEFSLYFDSTTQRDAFINETEVDLVAVFTASNDAAADFMSHVMPRVKVMSAGKNDPDGGIVQTFQFQALLNSAGGSGVKTEKTTYLVQDSAA